MNYIKEIISLNKILKKNNPIDKEDIESPHRKLIFIKSKIRNSVQNIILIILGTLAATIGFNGFLVPNGYIDGGVAGISLILLNLTSLPFGILLVLTSAPFILMGLFKLKLKSIFRSIFSVSLLAILVQIIHIPTLTEVLPDIVGSLLQSKKFQKQDVPTSTLALDAAAGTVHRKVCDTVRSSVGIILGHISAWFGTRGFISHTRLEN